MVDETKKKEKLATPLNESNGGVKYPVETTQPQQLYGEITNTQNTATPLSENVASPTPMATPNSDKLYDEQAISKMQENNQTQVAGQTTTPTTPTAAEPAEPMTYEEYLNSLKENYNTKYQDSVKSIEENRQNQISQADSAYEQNKATYGRNAEVLGNMGLSNSGYSDYLQSQAYAQKRDDIQSANKIAETNKQTAFTTYQDYLDGVDKELIEHKTQVEEQQKAYFNELLNSANSGAYSKEQLEQLGKQYGLNEEQMAGVNKAAEDYKNNIYNSNYATAYEEIVNNGANYDVKGIDEMLKLDLITQSQYDTLKTKFNDTVADSIKTNIDSNLGNGNAAEVDANLVNADEYYSKGYITKEQYQSIYDKCASETVKSISETDFGEDYKKSLSTYINANEELDTRYKEGKISKATYDSLKKELNKSSSNTCSGGYYVQGLGSGRTNDDIDITIGSTSRNGNGNEEIDLLCGDEVTDEAQIKELNRIATGDKNKSPKREGGWTWLHGDDCNSNNTPGKLIVAYGKMYIYTSSGWRNVKGDHSRTYEAIDKFLGR